MSVEGSSGLLGFLLDFATTEELLGVFLHVENNTESSSHVDSLALFVEVTVLLGVGASVSVDVLEGVLLVWASRVDLVVLLWLSDLTLPWHGGGGLLANSFVNFEEVVVVLVSMFGAASPSSFWQVLSEFVSP